MFSAAEIIDFAIQIEQNGENLCREAARGKVDPDLTFLLEWMAAQEAQHIRWFLDLRPKIRIAGNISRLEQFGKAFLGDVLGNQAFSLRDADFSKIQKVKELLLLLIEFEEDTVLFYEMLRTALEDKINMALLDKIIAEENQHVVQIKEYFHEKFDQAGSRNGTAAAPGAHLR
jgi:rubrerythrin